MIQASFNLNLRRFRSRMSETVKGKAERLTQTAFDSMVALSPYWSGNFRASWNVSEGYPIFNTVEDGSPASPLPGARMIVKAKSDFPVFYITNGQPYGQRLEHGWSKTQAPYGMVRITIASMR